MRKLKKKMQERSGRGTRWSGRVFAECWKSQWVMRETEVRMWVTEGNFWR